MAKTIRIPNYSLGEEIFNSVSHGIGALLGIAALVLMIVRARGPLAIVTVSLFGAAIICLYSMSCIYHALAPHIRAKQILRVLDHCNVYVLVFGTYIPATLLGVGGALGWVLFGLVGCASVVGIVASAVDVDRFQKLETACHLVSGWSILLGVRPLLGNIGTTGLIYMVLGGVMYSIGAVLYALGTKKKYRHSMFHVFCLLGTFFHFWAIYQYLL